MEEVLLLEREAVGEAGRFCEAAVEGLRSW